MPQNLLEREGYSLLLCMRIYFSSPVIDDFIILSNSRYTEI